ncbi:hypothetical protein H9L05_21070 (plasmid) [Hymenobacter qilianensis]|uniref:Uncharacterized protein n=1 Tax=Hymenobacter qilianensis TaxID=1385715 RepID=A0A7H0H1A8_9BACT|nr:hypothetical protein H9L05_21070 [Hymenobacter qilianensis]
MMPKLLFFLALTLLPAAPAPPLTGPQLVQQSIAYHDPQGKWPTLRTRLFFQSTSAAGQASTFEVELDNATGYFCHISHPGGREVVKGVVNGQEVLLLDGQPHFTAAEQKQYRLVAGAVQAARNFYTYLYGLPMKLRDAGTRVAAEAPSNRYAARPTPPYRSATTRPWARTPGPSTWTRAPLRCGPTAFPTIKSPTTANTCCSTKS